MHARRRRPSSVHALPLRSLDTSFSTGVSALASLASLVHFVAMPLLLSVVSRQHPLRRTAGEYLHVNRMASRRLGKFSSVTRNRGDPASYCSCLPSLREIHSKLKTNPPQTIDQPSLKRWPLPGLRHRSWSLSDSSRSCLISSTLFACLRNRQKDSTRSCRAVVSNALR